MANQIAVLVVEDEALTRLDIVDYLEQDGFKVYECANADQAIKILEEHSSISVLFTDVDMPGSMDGLRLSAAVRDRWPPIKIVVTSGHRDINVSNLPEGGLFFSKPYSQARIASAIRELLQ
jgi:two-component system, response regulator PdtaR